MKKYIVFLVWFLILVQSCFTSSTEYLFPIKIGDKYGYINYSGELIIDPIFKSAYQFAEGLAPVELENGYAYIDESSNIVFELNADFADTFSEGKAVVLRDRLLGYIDRNGGIIISPTYKNAESFSEGFANVSFDGDKYFYINQQGENIFNKTFERCGLFNEGYAVVMDIITNNDGLKTRVSHIIDIKGDTILDFSNFQILGNKVSNGLILGKKDNNWGFITIKGNMVIDLGDNYPRDFSEGYSVVLDTTLNKYGLIDTKGKWVIKPKYEGLSDMVEGLIPFEKDDMWGFIDINENVIVNNSFWSVLPFSNGMARVNPRDGYDGGYVNKDGLIFLGKNYIN